VAYESCGEGLPVVLLHANPGDHRDFDAILPELAARHRVIAIDWPGYGESAPPRPAQSASAMLFADLLQELVEGLGLGPAVFIGNSVGGFAAVRLAITHPQKVRGLVLVSPGGFAEHNPLTWLFCQVRGREWVTRLIAARFARLYIKRRTEFTAPILERAGAEQRSASMVAVDAAVWRSFSNPGHDLRGQAGAISTPTLLIVGRHDPVIRAQVEGRKAAALIPNATLAIPETGHMPFAEDPRWFLDTVQPFLTKVGENHAPSHL